MKVRDYIKTRRKELGLTMKELAQKVGVSEGTISRWESGDISNMKRDKIKALADALETTPSIIMGWDDVKFSPEVEQSMREGLEWAMAGLDYIHAELTPEEKIEDAMIRAYEKADWITKKHVLSILDLMVEAQLLENIHKSKK